MQHQLPSEIRRVFEHDYESAKLILHAALHADRSRFLPFPAIFRSAESKDPLDNSYTEDEFQAMHAALMQIKLDKIGMSEDPFVQAMEHYLFSIPANIVSHGSTFLSGVHEYEFRYSPVVERLRNNKFKARWYLFHGSPLGNWHSILRNGIRNMSKTKFMSHGAVHGDGVYATDSAPMALGYSQQNINKEAYVAVLELYDNPAKFLKCHGIYVIDHESMFIPRYLLKVNKTISHEEGMGILDYYKAYIAKRLHVRSGPVKRIEKEILELGQCVRRSDGNLSVKFRDIDYEIMMDDYPFSIPIVRLIYRTTHAQSTDDFSSDGVFINNNVYSSWNPTSVKLLDLLNTVREKTKGDQTADLYILNLEA